RSGTIPDGSSRHAGGGRDMADNAARRPRRGRFIFFAVLLALVALLAPVFPRPPSPGVRAGFDQVQDGMTEQQVEELLGGPRGVYDRARRGTVMTAAGTGPVHTRSHLSWWYFPDCVIEVGFDEGGRVSGKRIGPAPRQSLLGMAARWCELTFPAG